MNRILSIGAGLLLSQAAMAQIGTPYCFGNGCPCANDDAAAGCGNSGDDGDPSTCFGVDDPVFATTRGKAQHPFAFEPSI